MNSRAPLGFELVLLCGSKLSKLPTTSLGILLHIHVKGSKGELQLWVRPNSPSSVPHVVFVLFRCFKRWKVGGCISDQSEYRFMTQYIYEVPSISFRAYFVRELLLIVHTWNSSPLQSNLLRFQCTCCTVPTTSGRPHESPLVWAYQWPSLQPLSSPQLSHNDSLWA